MTKDWNFIVGAQQLNANSSAKGREIPADKGWILGFYLGINTALSELRHS